MKKPSEAVIAAASASRPKQSPDKLRELRDKVREARDLELEIASLEEQVSLKRRRLQEIVGGGREPGQLVDLFEELGVSGMSLEADGNLPAYDAELKTFCSASIPKEPERAAEALEYIEKVWRMPDLVKTSFVVDFGRGDRKRATELERILKKSKFDYTSRASVHPQTLAAEIRRRFESGKPLSPKELSTVGGFVGTHVKLSKRKED